MSSLSQHSLAAREAQPGVSAELRAALERLFAQHMSPISATAVVRNAVSKAQRRAGEPEAELRRQLAMSIKMLVPPQARDEIMRAVDQQLAQPRTTASTPSAATPPASKPSTSTLSASKLSTSTPSASTRPSMSALKQASRALESRLRARERSAPQAGTRVVSPASPRSSSTRPYPQVSADTTVVLVRSESDMNATRTFAREICKLVGIVGYPAQKVVTAVSELARNIARYAGEGRVCFRIDAESSVIRIVAEDHGPGIRELDEILAGNYRSRTGLGRGLLGVKRLASRFEIETSPAGTRVEIAFRY